MSVRSATASAAVPAQMAGIQTHLLWADVSDAEMRRQLDLVASSGATLTRVDVGWASVQEQGPGGLGAWYTGRLDALVAAANARGIKLLLTFMNTPCWASSAPESLKQGCAGEWWSRGVSAYAPNDPADYAAALGMLAARYKGKVAAWEIWNEPNSTDFFKAPDQAAAYAALVKAAYPAVKAADPAATVVAGSLSQSDHAFTARLYQLGIKGFFDAFSVHPYSDDVSPLDTRAGQDARYSFVRGVPAVHSVMLANGDERPMWLTEAGFSTSPVRTSDHWRNGVSEATQAQFVRQHLQQVGKWPWVRAIVWFNLQDAGTDRNDLYSNCGLRRWDGTAKPAWAAFQDGIASLDNGTGEPGNGADQPSQGPTPPVSGGAAPPAAAADPAPAPVPPAPASDPQPPVADAVVPPAQAPVIASPPVAAPAPRPAAAAPRPAAVKRPAKRPAKRSTRLAKARAARLRRGHAPAAGRARTPVRRSAGARA
jgi:hypothetical protein